MLTLNPNSANLGAQTIQGLAATQGQVISPNASNFPVSLKGRVFNPITGITEARGSNLIPLDGAKTLIQGVWSNST